MTPRPPHLLITLSPHGYGHAAMTAPIATAVRRRLPDLRLTLQTSVPLPWLETRFPPPFDLREDLVPDFGACMNGPLEVDVEATATRYAALHRDFGALVAAEAERLRRLRPDLVLSNVSYVMLAAAAEAGVPAIGYSCLTWLEIYEHVCAGRDEAPDILAQMRAAYASARLFLRPEPATPMHGLPNLRRIGPVAARLPSRRKELVERLGLAPGERVGLIGFGGMDLPLPFAAWARLPGWRWLAPEPVPGRPDMPFWRDGGLAFNELVAAVDVVVTKPGYGTFTECAVNGVPVLFLQRHGWAESRYLVDWLRRNGRALEITREALFGPDLGRQLHELFAMPVKPLPEPSGVDAAADAVIALLDATRADERS